MNREDLDLKELSLRQARKKETLLQEEKTELNGYYHYCNLDTLWKILDGDGYLARHVRFSNDDQEYTMGKRLIESYFDKAIKEIDNEIENQRFKEIKDNLIQRDSFMVCFCGDRDKLSQWRGYAGRGVCIRLALGKEQWFSCLPVKDKNKLELETKDNDNVVYKIASPFPVLYCNEDTDLDMFLHDVDINASISELYPFIKHVGFIEENEYRIIVDFEDKEELNNIICYFEKHNKKIPNVFMKFGYKKDDDNTISDKYVFISGFQDTEVKEMEIKIAQSKRDIKLLQCKYEDPEFTSCSCFNDNLTCLECSMKSLRKKENGLHKIIVIPQCMNQREIFEVVNQLYPDHRNVFIYCEGHLPITEIIVGPAADKSEIRESIENYLQNFYYFSRVIVNETTIPFRG